MMNKKIEHINLCCKCSLHCNCIIDDYDTEFEKRIMCKYCNTDKNIVHSGTDALVLGCLDDLYKICYKCSNEKRLEKND